MNQQNKLSAKSAFLLAGILLLPPPAVEASQKASIPPLKALAGPQYYDFLVSVSLESESAAAWYNALKRAVGKSEGSLKELLQHRLSLLTTKGGKAVEAWVDSPADVLAEEDESGDRDKAVSAEVAASNETEIRLLSHAVDGLRNPGASQWDDKFAALMQESSQAWQPNFNAFAYLIACDQAVASGDIPLGLEHCLWARLHADLGDRTTLRRAARERLLTILSQLGKLDSELAQRAALQIADRDRAPPQIRQLARDALRVTEDVDFEEIKERARRIACQGLNPRLAPREPPRLRPYLLASLHFLSGPGPENVSRKRASLFDAAIVAAEKREPEIAARLKVPYLALLLRMERYELVTQLAKPVWDQAVEFGLDEHSAELGMIASIAASQLQRPELQEFWRQAASFHLVELAGQVNDTPNPSPRVLEPKQVFAKLLSSHQPMLADHGTEIAKPDGPLASGRLNEPSQETLYGKKSDGAIFQWVVLLTVSAALAGCIFMLTFNAFHRPRSPQSGLKSEVILALPAPTRNVVEPSDSGISRQAKCDQDDALHDESPMIGETAFQLGEFMQEIVADLHRRVPASRFELASDSGGNYCQTIVADYSKMRRLTYRLGEATSRAAEGSRIMVCGTLRDSFNDDSLTLELSFTYPLPIPALKTESSLANSWAEDNVLASIVHLLDGSVSHQQEDGLGCLLTNVPVSAITALELDGRNRSFSQGSGVLVVDSDPRVLRSISAALQALGCECHCSESVDDASGLLRHYEKYAVVILDIGSANDGSFRLAQKVLKMPYSVRPRIIAMGDEADTGIGSRAATVGFDDYLTKPYSLDRLAALVNSARVH